MELHEGKDKDMKPYFRVFTHYGRMESLNNDNFDRLSGRVDHNVGGTKECRYLSQLSQAEIVYNLIYEDKTAEYKGYQKVELQSNTTGFKKNNSQLPGLHAPLEKSDSSLASQANSQIQLNSEVKNLIEMIFNEATNELTSKISARLTSRGIETPLG